MEAVYFGFLKKGPNRKEGDGDTPEIKKLQDAHIANIVRLANMKKMVMAGPFGDDGELRGIFVFRVASMKEAQDLAATDPMIKIDRLRIDPASVACAGRCDSIDIGAQASCLRVASILLAF